VKRPAPLRYYDRSRRGWCEERVHAHRFLVWLYSTRSGRLLERLLAGSPHASRLYGWWQRRPSSRRRIRPFVERMEVDLSECSCHIEDFASFADFFTRRLHPGARPADPDPERCTCPADGRVLVFPRVELRTPFRIKRARFQLEGLLRDGSQARRFDGGAMAVVRLGLADVHHVHFPDAGVPGPARSIPGHYHAGGPYAAEWLVPFYAENHRAVTPFASEHFGSMLIVEVGALTVGSIRQAYRLGEPVPKGAHKAGFEPGGSTVVLLFLPGAIRFDADLVSWSAAEVEVGLRAGESLGRSIGKGGA
jgi:phosphatidylserine decarboxylase